MYLQGSGKSWVSGGYESVRAVLPQSLASWAELMVKKTTHNNTTITLSMPPEVKVFLDQLAQDGYNRSNLMLKMIKTIQDLYDSYPQVPLPRGIEQLQGYVSKGELARDYENGRATGPKNSLNEERVP